MANALSNAMVPEFSDASTRSVSLVKLRQQSLKLMHWFFPASIVMLFFSRELYPVLFNSDFEKAASIFNIMILLIICRLVFPQTILLGHGKTRSLLMASSIEFIIKIVLSFLLIKSLNIYGIALATVAAFLTEKIYLTITVYRKLNIKPASYIPLSWLIFYSALLIAAFAFTEYNIIFP